MTKVFSIRLFRLSDLPRILKIEYASFGKDAYDRNLFADFHHKCGELFLVALKGRNVCGYAISCKGGGVRAGRAELVSIAVDARQRRQGIASGLLESTIRRLRRRGVVRLHLMVKVTNGTAIRFYQRHGFQKGRIVRGYYEDGAHGRGMSKPLAYAAVLPPPIHETCAALLRQASEHDSLSGAAS